MGHISRVPKIFDYLIREENHRQCQFIAAALSDRNTGVRLSKIATKRILGAALEPFSTLQREE